MSESNISILKLEIKKLEKEIKKHQKAYHSDDNPLISDQYYDNLCKRLSWKKRSEALRSIIASK